MKRVVAGLILQGGKLLVCQRTRHQTMPLKWEFPGGKIEEGEQPRDALRRELEEELGSWRPSATKLPAFSTSILTAVWSNCASTSFGNTKESWKIVSSAICSGPTRPNFPKFDFLEADLTLVNDLARGKLL